MDDEPEREHRNHHSHNRKRHEITALLEKPVRSTVGAAYEIKYSKEIDAHVKQKENDKKKS